MSIKCMNWAWGIHLPPTIKLILMSLADNADDTAQCFPSVNYIAKRCCISRRTVQRALKTLQQHNLIDIQHQNRKDGSNRSNLYVLNLPGIRGDNFTPPPHTSPNSSAKDIQLDEVSTLRHKSMAKVSPRCDTAVTPLTTIESLNNTTTKSNLVWPKSMNSANCDSILSLAQNTEPVVVQLLLDELAGQIEYIGNPVGYFRTLLLRYNSGAFIPAKAPGVQFSREKRQRTKRAIKNANKHGEERLQRLVKQQLEQNHG